MNRKQRRVAQSQSSYKPTIELNGKSYTIEETVALAMQQYSVKNFQTALDLYNLVNVKAPSAEAYNNQGIILYAMNRYDDVLAAFDKAIALMPGYAEAHNNRGTMLRGMNRYDEALASFSKAVELKPDYTDAHYNRAVLLQHIKRDDEALASYARVIALMPGHAEVYNNRGNILAGMKRYDEALTNYDKAIALKPDLVEAHNNRGNVLQELKRYDEALASFNKALALKPDLAQAYSNRGNTLYELRRYDEALASYAQVIAFQPNYAEAYQNRGNTLSRMKRLDEALANYDKALSLKPNLVETYNNRGDALRTLQRYDEALASFNKALALAPQVPSMMSNVLHTKMHLCDWQGIDELFDKMMKELEVNSPAWDPFALIPTAATALQQRKCAEISINDKYPPDAIKLWNGEKYGHDRIRIGYFSADFHNHATSYLIAKLFELHDRSKFEIVGFSFASSPPDDMRARLEKSFDRFIDVSAQSEAEIAKLTRDMEIDIAVDLKGLTKDSRTRIFTQRPAPAQVNYLGYPGTMGAGYIDYIIADQIVIPEEHTSCYTEKVVYLPNSYQVNDSSRKISDKVFTRRELGLPEEGFVFCSFNNNYKITPEVFDIWMRLLHKIPGSVLWLFVSNLTAVKNLHAEAKSRGIAGDRLVIAGRMEVADHLARHRLADLFLDTFNCNAHTTASDALWAGLPILTYLDQTFAGRVAASLLTAVGLPELITHSHADYEALALELATHPEKLSALRRKLAQNRETSPLFNTALFARNIEAAYIKMWERSQAGLLPDDIHIT